MSHREIASYAALAAGRAEAPDQQLRGGLELEEVLCLSLRDAQTFYATLENPPEPDVKLIAAMHAHSRRVKR